MDDDTKLESAYALETPEDNLRLYEAWATTYDADFVEGAGYRLPKLVADAFLALESSGPVLDVGCGTGAVTDHLPKHIVVDGLDLSRDMLDVAGKKGRYRRLIEANLLETLPIETASYGGVICAGTFTHGHVGGTALPELVRILRRGALVVVTIRDQVWDSMGFGYAFENLHKTRMITAPDVKAERIYANPHLAPGKHGNGMAYLTTFRRR
ncbi:MAG: class I SAM-dependent methyltransferase [Silicimonas sp.]|nr:class I SAM-dependent methyltransferase [Silicimonas sp.]